MKKSMLLSTIAMIVVVVVALSTATFAWFSSTASATISGTTTITSTRDFIVRTWQGGESGAWADTDTITLNATKVTALAPMGTGLGMVTKGDSVDDNVKTSPDLAWFTTDKNYATGKSKAYTTAALANKGLDGGSLANVSSFQLAPVSKDGATANFDIKFDIAGVTGDDLKTLNAINVVLEISSYNNKNAAEYYGTTYKVGNGGVTAGSPTEGVADVTAISADAKAGTAGTPNTNLKGDDVTSLTGSITAITNPATEIAAKTSGYYKTSTNLYKVITASRALAAGEYVLVNVYVWLDGYDAVDAMMAKAVNVSIAISK